MAYMGADAKVCLGSRNQMIRYEAQSNREDADLYGFDVVIRGDDDWRCAVGGLRGSSGWFLLGHRIQV